MDEDFFGDDDDLDGLPPNTLHDIETRARLSTQQAASITNAPHSPSSDYGLGDEEEVIDLDAPPHANVLTARHPSNQHHLANTASHRRGSQPPGRSDEVTQREQWRLQRYGAAAQPRLPAFRPLRPASQAGPASQQREQQQQPQPQPQYDSVLSVDEGEHFLQQENARREVGAKSEIEDLRKKLAQLEQDNATLFRQNEEARAQAFSKAGELAIIRANQDRTVKDYEQKLAEMQEVRAQEIARYKNEVATAAKDRERIETKNKFLEYDLAQEADRTKGTRRSGRKTQHRSVASPQTTPKKGASLPFRDGFNDAEVMAVSPSRSRERLQTETPKAASKRKRMDSEQSPAQHMSPPEQDAVTVGSGQASPEGTPPDFDGLDLPVRTKDEADEDDANHSELVQAVLDHRQENLNRTVEMLTKHALPSAPQVPLSSAVYDVLRYSEAPSDTTNDAAELSATLMDTWSNCLNEQHLTPLPLLMGLVESILEEFKRAITISVISKLVPVAIRTADLVATPKARAWANAALNEQPSTEVEVLANPGYCLKLLDIVSSASFSNVQFLKNFWSCMEHDFILVMLHRAQPLDDSARMLDLLHTSILRETVGAITISNDPAIEDPAIEDTAVKKRQNQNEHNLISRLANLLVDRREQHPPTSSIEKLLSKPMLEGDDNDEDPHEELSIGSTGTVADLHHGALDILVSFSRTERGGRLLATHRQFTLRLIRMLHQATRDLYDYNPHTHHITTALINQGVLLLGYLFFDHGEALDLRTKLAAESGAHHKFVVSLSRIAFSVGETFIEDGIWSEAADVAHKILDEFLSPEEGESVMTIFASGRSGAG